MSKPSPTLPIATWISLSAMFVAGLTLPLFGNLWLSLTVLIVYLIFPIRWILVQLVRERFFRGLGVAVALTVLQTSAGFLGFFLGAHIASAVDGHDNAAGFIFIIAMVLAMYVSAAHAIVYVPTVTIASFVHWIMARDPEPSPPPPPEIELGEKPGWDEGGKSK